MDVLSDAVAVMRSGRPRSARVAWRGPWGQRFPEVRGSAGFQVILQGSCWLVGPDAGPVALSPGDVLFFPHGDGYGLADSPSTPLAEPVCDPMTDSELFVSDFVGNSGAVTVTLCGGFRLDPGRAHPLLRDLPGVIHLPARVGHHTGLRTAIDLLGREVERPDLGTETVVLALLDTLLIYILRAWFTEPPDRGGRWATALADPVVGTALQAMHQDPGHPWTVQRLADRAGLSRAAFSQRFTTLAGQPPLTYLTWWRLTLAARVLRRSDALLSEIAAQVGYTSEFAFANAFKREYGIAPGRYRKQST